MHPLLQAAAFLLPQGLALFLQAHALSYGGAGQTAGYAPMLEFVPSATAPGPLLGNGRGPGSWCEPLVGWQAAALDTCALRGAAACLPLNTSCPAFLRSGLEALGALKLLSQPICQMAAGNAAGVSRALQQAGAVADALWPAAADPKRQEARRLLASRDWVPYVPPLAPEAEGSTAEQAPPDTPLAASLRAALERHCPGISLDDVRYATLVSAAAAAATQLRQGRWGHRLAYQND